MKALVLGFTLCLSCIATAEPNEPGRYQLMQLGVARADQYLIDTQTGRAWILVVDPETEERYFSQIRFANKGGLILHRAITQEEQASILNAEIADLQQSPAPPPPDTSPPDSVQGDASPGATPPQ